MALRRVGLPERSFGMRVRTYSKGMRQRLGIASVLVKDAPVVVMDEPTSGLDPAGAADFCDLLMEMRDAGKAVFISTHDIFRAREIADRVGSREELKSEGVRRRSLSFQDRSGEILRSKKVFCRHFRLLQNGRYGALRQIPRVIGNSRSMSSNRVPTHQTPTGISNSTISIFIVCKPSGRGSPCSLQDSISFLATS